MILANRKDHRFTNNQYFWKRMPTAKHSNFLFDFLINPKFRIWRHMLLVVTFILISIGQSIFVYESQMELLGGKIYLIGTINTVLILVFVYLNLKTLAPKLLLKGKYVEYFAILTIGTALYIVLKGIVDFYILLDLGVVRNFNGVTILDGFSNLTLYTVCIASSSVSLLLKQWTTDMERINDLKGRQLKSSVDDLKKLLNPRFLSNVLDYTSEIVKVDPKKTSDILFMLSDVLRYQLYDCKREKVLLESDIEFINKYLLLEQLSGQNNYKYTLSTKDNYHVFIPPFIFISVVQRIIEQQPVDIHINFSVDGRFVLFECVATDSNLLKCNFKNEEQRLVTFYGKNVKIDKTIQTVRLQLEAC